MTKMIEASMARNGLLGVAVLAAGLVQAAPVEWPGYNRTLTSERFVPLQQISAQTVKGLKVLCAYDTHETTAFQSGLLEVNGSLYWTTEHDIFFVDPNNFQEKWRAHEEFSSAFLPVSRGAAYLDGRADSGSKLWSSDLGGAIAGGVISYDTGAGQRVAVAAGMTSPIWPTAKVTAKVVILGRQVVR